MGIPKFFVYINERYPTICNKLYDYQLPEFDNFYIDLNRIVHNCSHPLDKDIRYKFNTTKFTKQNIFENVCHYIQILFQIIKPQKLMFLALDGVTPHPKLNQQRARLFLEAVECTKESQTQTNYENRFDSNCIIPGTEFMHELDEYIMNFIKRKILNNKLWQRCTIIFSSSKVPGEGEHKIMEYIRSQKSQPDYYPMEKHCLYGLDADLIMLGMCSHEPNFCLLREEITFGKKLRQMVTPEETRFCLLHLSLLRDYIEHEFSFLKDKLPFKYNLESLIDDWVLLSFLVGNDFIPNLRNLYVLNGDLGILYCTYIDILPELGGYINESGYLRLDRFERYMEKLGSLDNPLPTSNNSVDLIEQKLRYYQENFGFENMNGNQMQQLVTDYITTIQWNLHYYYHGCCSWSWYYPHHYAPYISDIKSFKHLKITFDLGKPLRPLAYMLAILPPSSRHLLPMSYQQLVVDSSSPIINYYPKEYKIDQNGKMHVWESVVLIPFIDAEKINDVLKNLTITPHERKRNKFEGLNMLNYEKDGSVKEVIISTRDSIPLEKIQNRLLPGVKQSTYFSTLKFIEHKAAPEIANVQVFPKPSQLENMILYVKAKDDIVLTDLAKTILGKNVYIEWPHLIEARVIGVSNSKINMSLIQHYTGYDKKNLQCTPHTRDSLNQWQNRILEIQKKYKETCGIDIGKTDVQVHVLPVVGKRFYFDDRCKVKFQTRWSKIIEYHPYQIIVNNITVENSISSSYKNVDEIFDVNEMCFLLSANNYGACAKVIKHVNRRNGKIQLWVQKYKEPDLSSILNDSNHENAIKYITEREALALLKCKFSTFLKIVGSVLVQCENKEIFNIGLNLRLAKKNMQVLGYTKKKDNIWYYSERATRLISAYIEAFPDVVECLSQNVNKIYEENELFTRTNLKDLNEWLQLYQNETSETSTCAAKILDKTIIKRIENIIEKETSNEQWYKCEENLRMLYKPGMCSGSVTPIPVHHHALYDRVVCVRDNFTVPCGYRGTIIGIDSTINNNARIYEIIFDEEFLGGLAIRGCSSNRVYKLRQNSFLNITFHKNQRHCCSSKSSLPSLHEITPILSEESNEAKENAEQVPDDIRGIPPLLSEVKIRRIKRF